MVHEKECIEIWFLAPYLPIYPMYWHCQGGLDVTSESLHVNPVLDHEQYLIEHIPCTRQYDRAIHDCARPTDALCLNEAVRIVVFQFRPGKEKHSSALFKQ
jgi:hypothetical protein